MIQEKKDEIRYVKQQAVAQEMSYNVVYGDIKLLDLDIGVLNRLLESNEGSRHRWRAVHMSVWRATIKPLKVVDLPNEILMLIFSNFQDIPAEKVLPKTFPSDEQVPNPDVENIKNIRLTCRAFCDVGSWFLIPLVDIFFTRPSLKYLEQVSKHPTISKGVRMIRVHTHTYNPLLANDRSRFAKATARKLRSFGRKFDDEATKVEKEITEDFSVLGLFPGPNHFKIDGFDIAREEARNVITTLKRLRQQDPETVTSLDPFETKISKAITEAHDEYRRRYQEQKSLIQDGHLHAAISAAIRQMPSVRRLDMSDEWRYQLHDVFTSGWDNRLDARKYKAILQGQNPFWKLMVHASEWGDKSLEWAVSPQSCLGHMLPSIVHAGSGSLTHLEIDITSTSKAPLEIAAEELQNLRYACQQLKLVQVHVDLRFYPVSTAPTCALLDAMLISPGLEVVKLSLLPGPEFQVLDSAVRFGTILANLPRLKLRSIFLTNFPVKSAGLRNLLDKVSRKIHLDLSGIYLVEGTWAEALELMRGKVDSSSRVVDPRGGEMIRLSPAEIGYLKREFSSQHRDGWYSHQRCPGPASFYIRGGNIPNPLI